MAAMPEHMTVSYVQKYTPCIFRRHRTSYVRGWFDGAIVTFIAGEGATCAHDGRVYVVVVDRSGELRTLTMHDVRLPNRDGKFIIPHGDSDETDRSQTQPGNPEPAAPRDPSYASIEETFTRRWR